MGSGWGTHVEFFFNYLKKEEKKKKHKIKKGSVDE